MRGNDERDDREDQERDRKLGKGSREVERFVTRYPRRQEKCGSDSHLHLYFEIYYPPVSNLRCFEKWASEFPELRIDLGAGNGDRTRDPRLGKPAKAFFIISY
jgi:hypothetical protein